MIRRQHESLLPGEAIHRVRVAEAAVRVTVVEKLIKLGITGAGVALAITERPVDTQHALVTQNVAHAAEKILYRLPTHDVQRVGAEDSIHAVYRPRVAAHIELDDRAQVRRARAAQALAQCGQIIAGIARLPRDLGQMGGKVQRMLSRATADLEHAARVREFRSDDLENRRFVAVSCGGYGKVHGGRVAWKCGLILRDNSRHCLSRKKVTTPMQAIEALLRRYSARSLTEPAPDDAALGLILESATRAPDHGRLWPWRFILIRGEGRQAFGELLADHLRRIKGAVSDEALERERRKALRAPLLIVVAAIVTPEGKIPQIEQILSAGAAAQNMLHAAFVLGFNAVWKTGGPAYDAQVKAALGLEPKDAIVGFIYVGTDPEGPGGLPRPDWQKFTQDWPPAR
jgi:nitroreductase